MVLAAGASSRFGKPKQLLLYKGESLVRRAARAADEAGCTPVVVIVGEHAAAIERELRGLAVEIVLNQEWREGLSSSIRTGLAHVKDADAVLLLTCDQPLIDAFALQQLRELGLTSGKPIVASAYADTVGVPAFFHRSAFPALAQLRGDEGAKRILLARRNEVAALALPAAATDIDRPSDYAQL